MKKIYLFIIIILSTAIIAGGIISGYAFMFSKDKITFADFSFLKEDEQKTPTLIDQDDVDLGLQDQFEGEEEEQTVTCTESDEGLDYYTYGHVKIGANTWWDSCAWTGQLREIYCESPYSTTNSVELFDCPEGYICKEPGACVKTEEESEEEPEEQDTTCNDSDGGHDTFTRGTTSGIIGGTSTYGTKKDGCYDETRLIEYFCYDGPDVDEIGKVFSTSYVCDYGCKEGACIPKPKCVDSDGGNEIKKYGTITAETDLGTITRSDECLDPNNDGKYDYIVEYWCEGDIMKSDDRTKDPQQCTGWFAECITNDKGEGRCTSWSWDW